MYMYSVSVDSPPCIHEVHTSTCTYLKLVIWLWTCCVVPLLQAAWLGSEEKGPVQHRYFQTRQIADSLVFSCRAGSCQHASWSPGQQTAHIDTHPPTLHSRKWSCTWGGNTSVTIDTRYALTTGAVRGVIFHPSSKVMPSRGISSLICSDSKSTGWSGPGRASLSLWYSCFTTYTGITVD